MEYITVQDTRVSTHIPQALQFRRFNKEKKSLLEAV